MHNDSTGEVKFLLVDDLEENLFALEALLKRDGLALYRARSGPEALELLLVHDFALALLDVQMDGMDGFELAELMRGTERTRRVPIIFLTAVATDERRHFRGYETGAVDFLFKPLNPQMLTSKAGVFFELARQRQELARQRDDLRAGAAKLARALERIEAHADNSPLAVVGFDQDFRIVEWSLSAERLFGWTRADMLGQRAAEAGWARGEAAAAFAELEAELHAGGRTVRSIRLSRQDGTMLDTEWYSSVLQGPGGRLDSAHAQILDVTERRRAEATQRLLLGELNHRVKNNLATVQAIANQTLRSSPDLDAFAQDFSGRLQALAKSHSLLSDATWSGAMLHDLLDHQLRLGTIDDSQLEVSGPEVRLPPQTALHLGLVLHELTTNANKYGALSSRNGVLNVRWRATAEGLEVRWIERGGPAVSPPAQAGFGTMLIEESLRAEGGEARCEFGCEGVSWTLRLPLDDEAGMGAVRTAVDRAAPMTLRMQEI
jgi:PAS domain S-box-containing protein